MSDITIRFDGLLLGAWLAVATVIYAGIAIGFGLGAMMSATRRGHFAQVARTGAAFAVLSLIGVGLTAAFMEQRGSAVTGPDWIDWLTLPALGLFAWGCRTLLRLRTGRLR